MKKRILSFMLSLFMVLTLLAPAVDANAATVSGEYSIATVVNPIANSWNTGTTYPNDGGPAYAFNDNTGNWWHTNYGSDEDSNKNVTNFTNGQVSEIPAFSDISETRVWIGGEFEEAVNLGEFTYYSRDNGTNWIKQWALYTANVAEGEPEDEDFILAGSGIFTTNSVSGKDVKLDYPVKATHFRLVAFSFDGGHATAAKLEMHSVLQMNIRLSVGESLTYALGNMVKVDNPTLSGLDSNIVLGEVSEGKESYTYSMAKLATAQANFNGARVELEDCLFTFTRSGDNYYIAHDDVYLSHNSSGSTAGKPCSTTQATIAVNYVNNSGFTLTSNGSYLFFHKRSHTNGNLTFDRQTGTDADRIYFDLFTPAANAPANSEIIGYKKLSGLADVVDGQQYLIAAKADDGNYYILNPVASGEKYNYVAQVHSGKTAVQLASAASNFNVAELKAADACLFTFTAAEGTNNYVISAKAAEGTTVYMNHRSAASQIPTTTNSAVITVAEKTDNSSLFTFYDNSNAGNGEYLYFYRNGNYYYDRWRTTPHEYCYFELYEPTTDTSVVSPIVGYTKVTSVNALKDGGQYLIVNTDTNQTPNYYFMYPSTGGSNYQHVAKLADALVKEEAKVETTITFTGVMEGETAVTVNGITYQITVKNETRDVVIRDDETVYIPGISLQGESDPNNVVNVVDQTGAPYTQATDIADGYYLLGNTSHLVVNRANGSGLAMQAVNYNQGNYSDYIWKIAAEGEGYTLQDMNGKYMNFSGSSVVLSDTPQVLNIGKRAAGGFSVSYGNYYLNNYSGGNHTATGWSGNDNAWYFYRVGIEVTCAAEGNAVVTLDGINYLIQTLPMSNEDLLADIAYAESTYKEEDYLVKGWRGYVTALAAAKEWAENATRQTELNAARKNLADAVAELVIKPVYDDAATAEKEMAAGAPSGTTENQPFIPKTNDTFGTAGSANFRIPAMITLSDGTIIAAADARWNHAGDACSIDIVVTKSEDDGKTWEYTLPAFFNDSTNAKHSYGACFIDPVLARDKNDKIYMMVDLFPGGIAINTAPASPHNASGFEDINGEKRLVLYLSADPDEQTDTNYAYYVGDYAVADGKKLAPIYEVYGEGEYSTVASFYLDPYYNLYTVEKEPMYCVQLGDETKKVQQNVFFNKAMLHVRCATYLYLITSEDKGVTWSEPMLLNSQIRKEENLDKFYGVGPGAGLCIDDGTEHGIVMLPAYAHSTERSSFIYSTDGGVTWKRSQDATTSQSSESCLVQLDATTVRHFYRSNEVHQIQYTDHTLVDGEWIAGEKVTIDVARNAGNQVSAIRYSKTIDGKPVIIYSTAAANRRVDGKLYIFTVDVEADGMPMTLVATYDNVPGTTTDAYAYSSIAELSDGSIGLVYESAGSQITYKKIGISEFEPQVTFDIPASEDGIRSEVAGYTLSLEGNIGVNFHMTLGEEVLAPEAGAYMNFALNGKDYMTVSVADAETSVVNDQTYYIFKCTVPVKDMDTEITAQIVLGDGRKGSEFTYKVKEYLDYMLENDETYADEIELVEAMSDFGEYAATYFTGESTGENPVLPELKEADVTYLESQKAEIMEDEDSIYYASSLLLKTDTILRHYFTENVEGSTQKGNLYYIDSEGIPAHKLGEEIVTTVERADGESVSIKYNPLSYAFIALTRDSVDESLANLMHAMYLYYQAAQDYRAETGN